VIETRRGLRHPRNNPVGGSDLRASAPTPGSASESLSSQLS
jgi:hypothetical protein